MDNTACLLIHGIAGGRYQLKRLEDYLNMKGIHAETITVKGHEQSRKILSESKHYEWLADANKRYLELKKDYCKVVVIGFSMGGLITLNLAKKNNPCAFVLVNCPIYCVDILNVLKKVKGDFKSREFKNIKRYFSADNIPVKSLGELKKLIEYTKLQLPKITAPALVLQCKDDDVVVPKSAEYIYSKLPGKDKKIIYYDKGGHHIFTENEQPDVYEDVYRFIEKMSSQ